MAKQLSSITSILEWVLPDKHQCIGPHRVPDHTVSFACGDVENFVYAEINRQVNGPFGAKFTLPFRSNVTSERSVLIASQDRSSATGDGE